MLLISRRHLPESGRLMLLGDETSDFMFYSLDYLQVYHYGDIAHPVDFPVSTAHGMHRHLLRSPKVTVSRGANTALPLCRPPHDADSQAVPIGAPRQGAPMHISHTHTIFTH